MSISVNNTLFLSLAYCSDCLAFGPFGEAPKQITLSFFLSTYLTISAFSCE